MKSNKSKMKNNFFLLQKLRQYDMYTNIYTEIKKIIHEKQMNRTGWKWKIKFKKIIKNKPAYYKSPEKWYGNQS